MSPGVAKEKFVKDAVAYLEYPRFFMRVTNFIGKPVEQGLEKMPAPARKAIQKASQKAIESALQTALGTLDKEIVHQSFPEAVSRSRFAGNVHGAGTAFTGALGGLFGLPALMLELPVTTTVMLRSISKIAKEFGQDLSSRETQLECLYVFSMGGPSSADDEMETAYYTSRLAFAELVQKALSFVTTKTAAEIIKAVEQRSAPSLVNFLVRLASRFELVVGPKSLGQVLPGIGAGAGVLINLAFSEHFNEVARFHSGLKRLELEYGTDEIRALYEGFRERMRH
jgi:hypothetical protein